MIDKMKEHNRKFVENGEYEKFQASKYPAKKVAIVTCMDTRLVELLPAALGVKNGDVIMIKNASGLVVDPYSDSMRSILISVYELGVEEVMVIAHTTCGVEGLKPEHLYHLMEERGIARDAIETLKSQGKDLDNWFTGFDDLHPAVRESVEVVKKHPLLPKEIEVKGYIMDTATGALEEVD